MNTQWYAACSNCSARWFSQEPIDTCPRYGGQPLSAEPRTDPRVKLRNETADTRPSNLNSGKTQTVPTSHQNQAFFRLVNLFANVPSDDRAEFMRMALADATAVDSNSRRWILAVRKELAVFLPVGHLKPSASVIDHLEDTHTEKEIAFALDAVVTELSCPDPPLS